MPETQLALVADAPDPFNIRYLFACVSCVTIQGQRLIVLEDNNDGVGPLIHHHSAYQRREVSAPCRLRFVTQRDGIHALGAGSKPLCPFRRNAGLVAKRGFGKLESRRNTHRICVEHGTSAFA